MPSFSLLIPIRPLKLRSTRWRRQWARSVRRAAQEGQPSRGRFLLACQPDERDLGSVGMQPDAYATSVNDSGVVTGIGQDSVLEVRR